MTAAEPIPYYSAQSQTCPLCLKRPVKKKMIYGHPVCKKCYYAFANRRQLGYLVDALIVLVPNILINLLVIRLIINQHPIGYVGTQILLSVAAVPLLCLFLMKDGFGGQSPGKRLADIQVLDVKTSQPIAFAQSFNRNSVLLVGLLPFVGKLCSLVVLLIISMQVAKGYRMGDRFAGSKAIWKRFAHLPMFGGTALACEQCGYDLKGNVSGVCPECGTALSEGNREQLGMSLQANPAVASLPS